MNEEKQKLRREIALQKRQFPATLLDEWSGLIFRRLEQTDLFQKARAIACYHALPGEVQTVSFLERWYQEKLIALPFVEKNELKLLPYQGKESVQRGTFGIWEPIVTPESVSVEKEIDLIIVPGVAFDRQLNRLGRGKGFYDRLLTQLNIPKLGVGFSFQVREQIPVDPFDQKLDMLITEQEIIE